jgi:hypothetical protein
MAKREFQDRCSTPELTRLAGACALIAVSVTVVPQDVVDARTERRIRRTGEDGAGGGRWDRTGVPQSGDRFDLFQHVDQPSGGLQHRQPLRQLLVTEGLV